LSYHQKNTPITKIYVLMIVDANCGDIDSHIMKIVENRIEKDTHIKWRETM
jgi:hypothetical protein